jgi:hypothetical protein
VIRINLLPPAARRRRRRRPGRELPTLALMSLGWALLLTAGALWIAATEAEIDELRAEQAALVGEVASVRASFDGAALFAREQALKTERAAVEQLRAGRRTPAPLLAAISRVVAGDEPEGPFAGRTRDAPVWLEELRELENGQWALTASAADLPALTGLLRRLRACEHVAALGPAEYVRDAGRLALRVTLTARE